MVSHLLPPPTVSGQVDSRGRILMPANAWQTEEQRAALATYAVQQQPPQVRGEQQWRPSPPPPPSDIKISGMASGVNIKK